MNLIYDLKSTHVVSLGAQTDGGFNDPTIGLRYTGRPSAWAMEARTRSCS